MNPDFYLESYFKKNNIRPELLLLDYIIGLELDLDLQRSTTKDNIKRFYKRHEDLTQILKRIQMKASDFDTVQLISKEAFADVKLVKHKQSQKCYAMKIQRKADVSRNMGSCSFWEEHDILTLSNSLWLMQVHYTFQDKYNLYRVMDFMAGGELLNLIVENVMTENMVRFYATEMVLAIDALHKMGYVHCNVSLDNFLIGPDGHLKLGGFGMSLKMNAWGEVPVSLSDAIEKLPPEVLTLTHRGKVSDWWSVGLCIYEMITGIELFEPESYCNLLEKVNMFLEDPQFPDEELSAEAKDLLLSLLTTKDRRLGARGVKEIMQHAFFMNPKWNFDTVREVRPPFIPLLSSEYDTRYFCSIEENINDETSLRSTQFEVNHVCYAGFSFYRVPLKVDLPDNPPLFIQQVRQSQEKEDLENQIFRLQEEKLQTDKDLGQVLTLTKVLMETSGELQNIRQAIMSDMVNLENENNCFKNVLRKMRDEMTRMNEESIFQMKNWEKQLTSKKTSRRETFYAVKKRKAKQALESSHLVEDMGDMNCNGHEFVLNPYRAPKKCAYCSKGLWRLFRSPQVVKCTKCYLRIHKYHLDDEFSLMCPANSMDSYEQREEPPAEGSKTGPAPANFWMFLKEQTEDS